VPLSYQYGRTVGLTQATNKFVPHYKIRNLCDNCEITMTH